MNTVEVTIEKIIPKVQKMKFILVDGCWVHK